MRWVQPWVLALTLIGGAQAACAASISLPTGAAELSAEAQIERVLHPLDPQRLAPDDDWLQIEPAQEQFLIEAPPDCEPPAATAVHWTGCGLLVWIDPGDAPQLGARTRQVLARQRMVFVAALRSGNTQALWRRRVPLAVQAALAACERFRCDPERRYVGGFSGGARAAGVSALAWPELFAGALMVGGGHGPGPGGAPWPDRARLAQAQTRSRFVLLIGDQDTANQESAQSTRSRLQAACFSTQTTYTLRRSGHRPPTAAELGRALDWLDQHRPDPDAIAACQQQLHENLRTQARQLLRAGATEAIQRWLQAFGNLGADYLRELVPPRP